MKKFVPNFITLLNLSCGIVALRYAMDQAFDMALFWFFLGIVFDFLDGFALAWGELCFGGGAGLAGRYGDLGAGARAGDVCPY